MICKGVSYIMLVIVGYYTYNITLSEYDGHRAADRKGQAIFAAGQGGAGQDAYDFSAKAHEGQLRLSGEPYIEHPLQVALTLAELQLDASSLAAALLHDVPGKLRHTHY